MQALILAGALLAGAVAAIIGLVHGRRQRQTSKLNPEAVRARKKRAAISWLALSFTLPGALMVLVFSPSSPVYLGENLGGWIAIGLGLVSVIGLALSLAAIRRHGRPLVLCAPVPEASD